MKTADIYWVNLDPTVGDEIKKKRPVVVLNPGHQKHLKLAIVVPVTGWKRHFDGNPFFVGIEPDSSNGLGKKSMVDCFHIRAVSHNRFLQRIGNISKDQMSRVKKSVALILDIDPEDCE